MPKVQYEVVEHDGGWAYKVDDTFSETFPSKGDAQAAANIAAGNHEIPGPEEIIEYQDSSGHWHAQISPGSDRPQTEVVDASWRPRPVQPARSPGPVSIFVLAAGAALAAAYVIRHLGRR